MSLSSAVAPAAARGKAAPSSLVEAVRGAIFRGGYVQDLAARVGVQAKQLYRWSTDPENDSDEHRALPAHMIETLTRETGQLDILEYLADSAGCILVRRPAPCTTAGALVDRVATVTADFADVQAACAPALDGVTPEEAKRIEKEISDLEGAAEALRLSVRAAVDRRPLAKATGR
jgi:hypothetical protein